MANYVQITGEVYLLQGDDKVLSRKHHKSLKVNYLEKLGKNRLFKNKKNILCMFSLVMIAVK